MKRCMVILVLGILTFAMQANATIINIPDDYPTIQEGIDASTDGDTVLVQPDTYVENINFNGHNIVLGSLFLTTGDTTYIGQTIIDGDSSGSVVTFEDGETASACVTGFTIQNGLFSYGGGIYCLSSNPTISNNIIRKNNALALFARGGGISCHSSNPTISNNVIIENNASAQFAWGGGISCSNSSPLITDNIISENISDGSEGAGGGGIACLNESNPTITNNLITSNEVFSMFLADGGGIHCDISNPAIINNTITGNAPGGVSGGGSNAIVKNNIIWANAFFEIDSLSSAAITYCDIRGGWEGEGNIDADPLFRDPDNGDFHLMSTECSDPYDSPCIDTGSPAIIDSLLDCSWGLGTILSDMGAYGGDIDRDWNWTVNVPDDYPTIQRGITFTIDGDTVLVQPGTYVENINFNGHNIVLGSLFLTTGDTSYISQTVLDGSDLGTVVLFENDENEAAILTGFTITNGLSGPGDGGGIHCENSSPTIRKNRITENFSVWGVGGIRCTNSSPMIRDNVIDNNGGGTGGIGCLFNSNPDIIRNIIVNNGGVFGGAIYCWESSPNISQNSISENEAFAEDASGFGGGICCRSSSSPLISNNTIKINSANNGGAIFCGQNSNPRVTGNIIYGNYADTGGGFACEGSHPALSNNTISMNVAWQGGGIYCEFVSNPVITNTILWANSAEYNQEIWADTSSALTITYCDIQDTLWPGEGNIDVDPLFRDPENGDFHLMSTACGDPDDSPCIDAGSPDIIDSLLDCSWGLGTILSDMGAYGGGDSTMVGIDDDKEPEVPIRFGLSQNYPNPFNALTIIRYSLPSASDVTIEIFDILGRRVETLVQGEQPAGYHQVVWDAENQSSGMYFYRIQAGEYIETRKMVLLK